MKTAEKMECLSPQVLSQFRLGHLAEVRAYLELHIRRLDENPNSKVGLALRALAATVFPQETNWKTFVGIAGLTDPSPSQDGRYREGFPILIELVPPSVRETLAAIGRR